MLKRLRFFGVYLLFWVTFFEVGRILFLLYEWPNSAHLGVGLLAGALASGIRMDLSAACYLTAIPVLIIASDGFIPPRLTRRVLAVVAIVTFRRAVLPLHDQAPRRSVLQSLAVTGLVVPLFVGVRGGTQLAPINQSSVYFSGDDFANQAAINPAWNLFASVAYRQPDRNAYRFTDNDAARHVVDSLLGASTAPLASSASRPLLRVRRPNIVLIIWEGLTAKVVGPLGGRLKW